MVILVLLKLEQKLKINNCVARRMLASAAIRNWSVAQALSFPFNSGVEELGRPRQAHILEIKGSNPFPATS